MLGGGADHELCWPGVALMINYIERRHYIHPQFEYVLMICYLCRNSSIHDSEVAENRLMKIAWHQCPPSCYHCKRFEMIRRCQEGLAEPVHWQIAFGSGARNVGAQIYWSGSAFGLCTK